MTNNKFIDKLKTDVSEFCAWALVQDENFLGLSIKDPTSLTYKSISNLEELEMEHLNDLLVTIKNLGITRKEFYQGLSEQTVNNMLKNKGVGLHIKKEIKEELIKHICDYDMPVVKNIYWLSDDLQKRVHIYIKLVKDCLLNHNKDSDEFKKNKYWEDKLSKKEFENYNLKLTENNAWLFKTLIKYGKKNNLLRFLENDNKEIVAYNKEYEKILINENIGNRKSFSKENLSSYINTNNIQPLDYLMVNLEGFNKEFTNPVEYNSWASNAIKNNNSWSNFRSVLGLICQNVQLKQINSDLIDLVKNSIGSTQVESQELEEKYKDNHNIVFKNDNFLKKLIEKKEFLTFLEYVDETNALYKYLGSRIYSCNPEYINVQNSKVFFEHFVPLLNTYQNNIKEMTQEEQISGAKSLLNIYEGFKNKTINEVTCDYNGAIGEEKFFWKKSLSSKTEDLTVYQSYLYNLLMGLFSNKDLFLLNFKDKVNNLTICINEENKTLETSAALIGDNLNHIYNSNIFSDEEKNNIKNDFRKNISTYMENTTNYFQNNFGMINSLKYENQVNYFLQNVTTFLEINKELNLFDNILNKKIHIKNNSKVEEDKPLILEVLPKIKDQTLKEFIKEKKINSEIIYKKKNVLEWYVFHKPETANKIIKVMIELIKEDDIYKNDIKMIIDRKPLIKMIDQLKDDNENNNNKELKSNYYYLFLELNQKENKEDGSVVKTIRKNKI